MHILRLIKVYTGWFLLHTILENANYCIRKLISDGLGMARRQREGLQKSKTKLSGAMAMFRGDGYVHDLDCGDRFMGIYMSKLPHRLIACQLPTTELVPKKD